MRPLFDEIHINPTPGLKHYTVFIGYDPEEDALAKMCANSIRQHTSDDVKIVPLIRDHLRAYGHIDRKIDRKATTQFSLTRFAVPWLMGFRGLAIFLDCDMLITRDIKEMFAFAERDPSKAVHVVKHNYKPSTSNKMGGKKQTTYPRKNWSSAMVFNCEHTSCQILTTKLVNTADPSYLHQFAWCIGADDIGTMPAEFNWLVGEYQDHLGHMYPNELPFNIHHTLGAPIFKDHQDADFADYWRTQFLLTFGRGILSYDMLDVR